MLTRKEVSQQFTLTRAGFITNPGKFEGEHWTTVAFHDLAMNGSSDDCIEICGTVADVYMIDDALRRHCNFRKRDCAFILHTNDVGFVEGQVATAAELHELQNMSAGDNVMGVD